MSKPYPVLKGDERRVFDYVNGYPGSDYRGIANRLGISADRVEDACTSLERKGVFKLNIQIGI